MREGMGKYRGKRLDNGEWVYGYLIKHVHSFIFTEYSALSYVEDCYKIICLEEVDPATVGQFTGLKDKNGKDIYEGDLFPNFDEDGPECSKMWVIFDNGSFRLMCECGIVYSDYVWPACKKEIIGNIHDKDQPKEEG